MMPGHLTIDWIDTEEEARREPKPELPEGEDLVLDKDALRQCITALTYPAPGCGLWVITCERCKKSVHVTVAGLADDPRSISIDCDPIKEPAQ